MKRPGYAPFTSGAPLGPHTHQSRTNMPSSTPSTRVTGAASQRTSSSNGTVAAASATPRAATSGIGTKLNVVTASAVTSCRVPRRTAGAPPPPATVGPSGGQLGGVPSSPGSSGGRQIGVPSSPGHPGRHGAPPATSPSTSGRQRVPVLPSERHECETETSSAEEELLFARFLNEGPLGLSGDQKTSPVMKGRDTQTIVMLQQMIEMQQEAQQRIIEMNRQQQDSIRQIAEMSRLQQERMEESSRQQQENIKRIAEINRVQQDRVAESSRQQQESMKYLADMNMQQHESNKRTSEMNRQQHENNMQTAQLLQKTVATLEGALRCLPNGGGVELSNSTAEEFFCVTRLAINPNRWEEVFVVAQKMEERILAWPGLRSVQAFKADGTSIVVITHWACESAADAASNDMEALLSELGPFLTAPPCGPMKSVQLLGGSNSGRSAAAVRGQLEGPLAALAAVSSGNGIPPQPADACAGAPLVARYGNKKEAQKGIPDVSPPTKFAQQCTQQ